MNTRVFKVITICALLLCSINLATYSQDDALKKMVGKWTYKMDIPDTGPVEAECNITLANSEVKAVFPTPMGEWTTTPLKLDNGKYTGNVSSDFGEIKYLFSWKAGADILILEMSFDMGSFPPIEMTRAK